MNASEGNQEAGTDRPADAGTVRLALAVAGVAVLFVGSDMSMIYRIASAFVFLLAFIASQLLYWSFLVDRLPLTRQRFRAFKSKAPKLSRWVSIFVWLVFHYPCLVFLTVFRTKTIKFHEQTTELGYLTLLAAFFVAGMSAGAFIVHKLG